MYIYEGHMGSLYVSDYILDYDDLYCEECGDSDWFIGQAETKEEAWELLRDKTATFDCSICENCQHFGDWDYCDNECEGYQHSGGWDLTYVQKFINTYWDE